MKKFNPITLVLAAFLTVGLAACTTNPRSETPGQYVDDAAITTKVKAAIFNEPTLKSAEINVETFKQVVQLSGFVTSQANIDRATTLARGVNGVVSVKNDMRLK